MKITSTSSNTIRNFYDKFPSNYFSVTCIFWVCQIIFNIVMTSRTFNGVNHNVLNNYSLDSFRQQRNNNNNNNITGIRYDIVKADDYIYKERIDLGWDSSPIVIEKYKLIFFTIPKVGCTVWKQLFRRMEDYRDWNSQDWILMLPHNPSHNGLKYLYNYTAEEASVMMTSPEWKRAIMVREPKIRFLSTFIDKAVENGGRHISDRCCPDRSCLQNVTDIIGFMELTKKCPDEHWRSQNDRIDDKYWPYITNVLRLENAQNDAKQLLKSIGAWDEDGKTGWGHDSNISTTIFEKNDASNSGEHTRYSTGQIWKYLTPEIELKIENYYQYDYINSAIGYKRGNCLTCINDETKFHFEN